METLTGRLHRGIEVEEECTANLKTEQQKLNSLIIEEK